MNYLKIVMNFDSLFFWNFQINLNTIYFQVVLISEGFYHIF